MRITNGVRVDEDKARVHAAVLHHRHHGVQVGAFREGNDCVPLGCTGAYPLQRPTHLLVRVAAADAGGYTSAREAASSGSHPWRTHAGACESEIYFGTSGKLKLSQLERYTVDFTALALARTLSRCA